MLESRHNLALSCGHSHPLAYGKQVHCRQCKGPFKSQHALPSPDLSSHQVKLVLATLSLSSPLSFSSLPFSFSFTLSLSLPLSPLFSFPLSQIKLHIQAMQSIFCHPLLFGADPLWDAPKFPVVPYLTNKNS